LPEKNAIFIVREILKRTLVDLSENSFKNKDFAGFLRYFYSETNGKHRCIFMHDVKQNIQANF
jgi:hypothetical protein